MLGFDDLVNYAIGFFLISIGVYFGTISLTLTYTLVLEMLRGSTGC